MTGGSQQIRLFRRAVRDGLPVAVAAQQAEISVTEARLIADDDRVNPPLAEAYRLLGIADVLADLCGPSGRSA